MTTSTTRQARQSATGAAEWVENRPSRRWWPRIDLGELWSQRELIFFLALRDLKLRYSQTLFGIAWVVIPPLAAAAIFLAIFGRGLDVPSDGIPYLVFVYAGMIVWSYVSSAVGAAAESLSANTALVTRVYFPRLVAPLAAVLPGLLDFAVGLMILAVLIVLSGTEPSVAVLTLPIWILAAAGVALSVGIWLAALNAQYRDVRYALGFSLQLWFFISPIVYASSVTSGFGKYVF